jgi:hypothetical protein
MKHMMEHRLNFNEEIKTPLRAGYFGNFKSPSSLEGIEVEMN